MLSEPIVICGAGIAGIATAYYILKYNKDAEVIIIDINQPLSFTTSKSGENFREYWPQKCMQQFISHSIDLMEELREQFGEGSFNMEYSGYNFISHSKEKSIFGTIGQECLKDIIEEITDSKVINNKFPYLSNGIQKIVAIKKAGKMDVYAMGSLMLREAKNKGLKYVQGEILGITKEKSKFQILLDTKKSISANKVVIAAGPFINNIGNMLGIQFPVENIPQRKFIIPDPKNIIPKSMPFTIYADSQFLAWSDKEIAFFASEEKYKWLLDEFPGGIHIKPEGEGIKLGWAFNKMSEAPKWEPSNFDFFPQIVLKGASHFIPQLSEYENNIPTPIIEYSGYYTRTKENWPLIGPTEVQNTFVIGALSGYGTMAACAAGKLCSEYILNIKELPNYATYFHPLKYQNQDIVMEINELKSDGQL
jgi:glycine/D-amino acid oxidase-like deaminating enzyme